MSDPLDGITHGQSGGFNSEAMQAAQAQADEKAAAKLALDQANADAAKLLAELEAANPGHKMPSPYAPGEAPPPPADPVKGVGQPEGWNNDLWNALDGNFKPVNFENLKTPTNTSSHTVDFAQKIRDANKYGKK